VLVFGSEVLQRKTLNVVPDNLSAEPGKRHLSYMGFRTYMDYSQAGGKQPKPVTTLITINPLNPELNPICYLLALL